MAVGEGNYYSSFGKFGAKFEYSDMELDANEDLGITNYSFGYGSVNFKNTLKKSGPVKAKYEMETYNYGDLSKISNIKSETEKELKVSYKDVTISAPTGFEEKDVIDTEPSEYLITLSSFLSL